MRFEGYRDRGHVGTDVWAQLDAPGFRGLHVFTTAEDGTRVHRHVTRTPVAVRLTCAFAPTNVAVAALVAWLIGRGRRK